MGDHERAVSPRSRSSRSRSSSVSKKSLPRGRRSLTPPLKVRGSPHSISRSPTPRKKKHHKHGHRSRSRSIYSKSRSRGKRDSSYEDHRSSHRRDKSSRYRHEPSRSPRRRHYGDRENPRESKCVGVFGLSLYTEERQLRDIFERFGPLDDLKIVYDYHTGRSRGFGFIYYRYIEDAVEAKESAPGLEIDGRKIRVDYSITERPHTPTPGTYMGRGSAVGYRGRGGGGRYRSPSPYKSRGYSSRGRERSYSRSRSISPRRY